ncbi:MAG: SHOCT domain-containing protein [Bacteroidia bacterium]|nr:SHOCT domain-containing protein [Bacteroidia bacterium]
MVLAMIMAVNVMAQQRPPGYVPLNQLKKAQSETDSLTLVTISQQTQITALNKKIENRDVTITALDSLANKQKAEIAELTKELETYRGQNLKLDQSNRILIIFNSIVGFLLLVTLVWFVRNLGKKKSKSNFEAAPSGSKTAASPSGIRNVESKLEQLERLSKLREKGILTEEEFNFQKQQVLG